ncbi:prolipoprotein diacylglyceryl transferase [Paenibacillus sp. HB172176]|uniref:prolipoprotein diacylglyceryl transferase n=1 Tax=Paenibacillus sp. HB172176 TaxID=2493690 RepID=UPI00143CAFC4|nr:prolipoprotein diacylglyceryl transferase [Paenibacillus sp. HB172176]
MQSLALNPVVFELGNLTVRWYGIILGLGALIGLMLAIQEGKRFGIKPDFFMDLLLFGAPTAIICARIYYVAFKWDEYKDHPIDMIKIWEGGIAIYGAIIGALLCGFFYARYKGYSFLRIVDICVPGLLAGQMIGRWGNFMNQEAFGGTVSESFLRHTLHLPSFIVDQMFIDDAFRQPTFLYESIWSLAGILILLIIRRQKFLRAGELTACYFIWYSIGRFYIEALRTDSLAFIGPKWLASFINALWAPMDTVFDRGYLDPSYGNIRISQALAVLLIIGAILFIVLRRVNGKANVYYADPIVTTRPERNGEAIAASQEGQTAQIAGAEASVEKTPSGEAADLNEGKR